MRRWNLKPTTPEQGEVIVWMFIIAFLVAGSVGFYFAFQAPPAKAQVAAQLQLYCWAFYGLAAVVYISKRVIANYFD